MFHAIPRCLLDVLGRKCPWFSNSQLALPHPAPRRRLGHVTYLPDHQRQQVLDGIYDSRIPKSRIPRGKSGKIFVAHGDTSLACPPRKMGELVLHLGLVSWDPEERLLGPNGSFKMNFHLASTPMAFWFFFQPSNFRAVLWPNLGSSWMCEMMFHTFHVSSKSPPGGLKISRAVLGYEMFDHVICSTPPWGHEVPNFKPHWGDMSHFKHGHQRDPEQLGVTMGGHLWRKKSYYSARLGGKVPSISLTILCWTWYHNAAAFHSSLYKISENKHIHTHTVRASIIPQNFSPCPSRKAFMPTRGWRQLQVWRIIISWIGGRNLTRSSWAPWRCFSSWGEVRGRNAVAFWKWLGAVSPALVQPGRKGYVSTLILVLDVSWYCTV